MSFSESSPLLSEEELFDAASALPVEERAAYLDAVCDGRPEVRAGVEQLLASLTDDVFMQQRIGPAHSPAVEAELARLKPEEEGERIGHYKLLQQIGEGGFGTVWMAEQLEPVRRRVALKIIKLGMDTREVVARFEQERQALALMDHPNIARVLDAGATPFGRPFFVMELVRGVKITEYCDQAKLSTADRLRLFIAVCHALQHAHQKGIIHRDLKPSNILVTLHDGVPVPKVIDFGVAKATQQQRLTDLTLFTKFEQMIGTPLYMSPEQAEMSGLDVDTRSDIYSLGVLLYELLAGRTPFDPEKLVKAGFDEMRRVIREEEAPRPSTYVSTMAAELQTTLAQHRQTDSSKLIGQIRGDLDWIVMKALEKDRTRRYETANEFAQDIQRHLVSEPVQARPPSAGYRFRRLVQRNKATFAAVAAVFLVFLAGVAGVAWQAIRANAALSELSASAPAFEAMARGLVAKEQFDQAIEKLDIAIKLQPENANYLLTKADLLESQFRFAEAAGLYRDALRLNPAENRAATNSALCVELGGELRSNKKISKDSLSRLFATMNGEGRSAAEMAQVGLLLGEENGLLLRRWLDRLHDLPIPPDRPLTERLTVADSGMLSLDLSGTSVSDLSLLTDMPLETLVLSGCRMVTDLRPLQGMPLKHLFIGGASGDYSMSGSKPCDVRDLSALRGLKLSTLNLEGSQVGDLSPLRGMPLEWLSIRNTSVLDLGPLKDMPLRRLDCTLTRVRDFLPLTGAPLEFLNLQSTPVDDLSFLDGMPLKTLLLNGCFEARGFSVLTRIPSLESIMLPAVAELPEDELAAIGSLRKHPNLRQVQIGGSRQDGMAVINTVASSSAFWERFEQDVKFRAILRDVSGGKALYKRLKVTWQVWMPHLSINDLAPLEGAPISTLDVTGTNVADLAPLKGMQIDDLNLSDTNVSDLEPLRGSSVQLLCLAGCKPGIDLAPLLETPKLKELLLPPHPQNLEVLREHPTLKRISFVHDSVPAAMGHRVAQTTEEFWGGKMPEAEVLARANEFDEAANVLWEQARIADSFDAFAMLGVVIAAKGDQNEYQSFCRDRMSKFESADTKCAAEHIVRICCLRPDSSIDPAELEQMMKRLSRLEEPPAGMWRYSLTEGLREFRGGNSERALELLTQVQKQGYPEEIATATVILSMACQVRGQTIEAKRFLARARELIAPHWPASTVREPEWCAWLSAYLLLQEAEKALSSATIAPAGR